MIGRLTVTLWMQTSCAPSVVVAQQSSTMMQSQPALYASESVPRTL